MIIFGSRLFGKVDAVPGMFHVATKFFHINFLPLIPTGSWLVVDQDGSSWRGVEIPVSMKSVAVAWIRFLLCCFALFGLIFGLTGSSKGGVFISLLGLGGFIGSYYWSWIARADGERAVELAQLGGLNPDAVDHIRALYGMPTLARFRPPPQP